ncbi:MAG: hypothetical protein IKB50_03555 [Clostridia bacterium]|nr:hypothetical protein [Clostridia bacterium]
MRNNKERAGAYFGLHFDFHAGKYAKDIGAFTKAETIGKYLDEVKPDYIQLDTKGHPGYVSYFSEYGDVAPGLTVDHIKIIREETEKRNISLIAHHSSLWDEVVCKEHAEWAIVNADGSPSDKFVDCTSEYVDKKYIPMLKELCEKYGFDGAWIDGDCWCVQENYRKEFVDKFLAKSGYDSIDTENLSSESHLAFRRFCREEYEKFAKYSVGEVNKEYPGFEMILNNIFASHYPMKPYDYVNTLSQDVFDMKLRVVTRTFASHDKPWDVMAWGHPRFMRVANASFSGMGAQGCVHHPDRVRRFASQVISHGGGFQVIGSMTEQGEILTYDLDNMKNIAEFMNERKQFNYKSTPVNNAAVWFSEEDLERTITSGDVFEPSEMCYALCDIFVDCGRPIDVICDYHIDDDMISDRKTIIIPETVYIDDRHKEKLLAFAKDGGNLIVIGVHSCKVFGEALGGGVSDFDGKVLYAEKGGAPYFAGTQKAVLFDGFNGREIVKCFADKLDSEENPVTATALVDYGKGKVAFVGWDIVADYYKPHYFAFADIMRVIMDAVDTEPVTYLKSGTNRVELIPATKDGKLLVNVINTTEYYHDIFTTSYGDIPPICDIEIAVKCDKEPTSIMLEPEHKKAEFTYDGKYAYVKIDKLHIHTIITVE